MAVLQFFCCGFADFDHFDVEVQGLASKRMVSVKANIVINQFGNGEDNRLTVTVIRGKAHSNSQLCVWWELIAFG